MGWGDVGWHPWIARTLVMNNGANVAETTRMRTMIVVLALNKLRHLALEEKSNRLA